MLIFFATVCLQTLPFGCEYSITSSQMREIEVINTETDDLKYSAGVC